MKLTEKQKRFIDFFIETGNQTEAARRAGYKKPQVQGAQNLEKLRDPINERLTELEDHRIAKADEVLKTLTRVLRREEKETVVVTCKSRRSYYDDNGKKVIEEAEAPQAIEIPTQIRDVNKAAELLGKRYCLYTDKLDISGETSVKIVDDLEDEQHDS
ncbi:MAG: terminase small subunit [Clostridiales bacterium]|jgi:phage terminase small subunit|nr:terminase small subunit [Clostridiales bacterium]MCI1951486.1 terminase small subunit [Clostridiales bacterium]MCI1960615.1 terminase small subunit [Clostridiales bacterium]MCI1960661.1 terminase small subunit [Clostridiales bacterium]MCI2021102.1 terminase small subunit [Clostridiales bacterium]